MTLTSGHYADLNMWFMFTVAVLYKYMLEQQTAPVEAAG
jgi:hypothetical protein